MTNTFAELEKRLHSSLSAEIGSVHIGLQRAAEMRYRGQKQGIRAEIGTAANRDAIREIFNRTYMRRYGHVDEGAPIEFVSLYLTGAAHIKGPSLPDLRPDSRRKRVQAQKSRAVHFPERGGRVDTPVYQRAALKPDFQAPGPAIIEEYGSTTVVGPDDHFRVGRLWEIRITFTAKAPL